MEIKSRKIKREFLLFASLSAEKISVTACKVFGKKKQEQVKKSNKERSLMLLITNLFHLTAGRYCASNSDVYQRTSCFHSFDGYLLTGEQRVRLLRGESLTAKHNL
jgi:hypothetical protein